MSSFKVYDLAIKGFEIKCDRCGERIGSISNALAAMITASIDPAKAEIKCKGCIREKETGFDDVRVDIGER